MTNVTPRSNLPITETWDRTSWVNFDTYQALTDGDNLGRSGSSTYPYGLNTQNHIDVRDFLEGTWTSTAGTVTTGYISALGHIPAGKIAMSSGSFTFTSHYAEPIDLTALEDPNALLTVALPNFPASSVSLNSSFLDLSSDGFSEEICSLEFSNSTSTPTSGNTTLTWPYSALTGADMTAITGVRFRITATGSATLYLAMIRLVGALWVPTNVDFDNVTGVVRAGISLTGVPTISGPTNQSIPIILRSSLIAGIDDPRPINSEVSVLFNTGSQTANNSVSVYTREQTTAFITQIDLEGDTQAQLTGQPQPAGGVSEYAPRTMSDLDNYNQSQLDGTTQINLERTADPVFISWEGCTIVWGPNPQVLITNSAYGSSGYQYAGPTYSNNTTYAAVLNVTDTTVRLVIYDVDQDTLAIEDPIFDSTVIPDVSMFPRRPGRIGVQVALNDGDTWVGPIRPRGLVFAEYQSTPFNSLTPVKGARLYTSTSPNIQYWKSWTSLSDGTNMPTLVEDTNRTTTGSATAVTVITPSSAAPGQGVISNVLSSDTYTGLSDFANFGFSFDLWFPSAALNAGPIDDTHQILECALLSEDGNLIPLLLPALAPDHWQHIITQADFGDPFPQSGIYQLIFYYNGVIGTTFWLDNVQLYERSVTWSARSVASDPWNSNFAPWTPFRDFLNSDSDGIRFFPQGKQLQVLGQGLKQNSVILGSPKIVPIYADLGRLVWPETVSAYQPSGFPTAVITDTNPTGREYIFSGTSSTGASGSNTTKIVSYEWAFSDGTFASGPSVTHTFPSDEPLPLIATLTVKDNWGQTNAVQWFAS